MLTRSFFLVLLALGSAHAEPVFDPKTACLVAFAYPEPGEVARWSGACVDGKASGQGTLTSSNDTSLVEPVLASKPDTERSLAEVKAVMDKNKGKVFSLYQAELRKRPSLSGQLVVQLVIAPSGQVVNAKLLASELASPDLEGSLLALFSAMDFGPKAGAKPLTLSWPIEFHP